MSRKREQVIEQIRGLRAIHKIALGKRPALRKRLPRQLQPDMIRMEYRKTLEELLFMPMRREIDRYVPVLLPAWLEIAKRERGDGRQDAPNDIRSILEKIAKNFETEVTPAALERLAARIGKRTSDFQREQLMRQLKAAVGVEPFLYEPSILSRVEAFTAENVSLLKTVPQRYFSQVEQRLISGIRAGKRATDIAAELSERFGVAEDNAYRIANDQVGKFFGELNRVRQGALGIDGYIWRTVGDNRVREWHEEREGERFDWDSPPDGGHPGEEVNCRCFAEPDLSDVVEAL